MRLTRTMTAVAAAGLLAGASTATAQAAPDHTINRGAVVYSATYTGKIAGMQGNVHDVSIESQGDMNYVQSYYCRSLITADTKEGCVLRSDRRIAINRSPVAFRVSSTARSATIKGTLVAYSLHAQTRKSLPVNLTLRASSPLRQDRRDLTSDSGTFAGLPTPRAVDGFLSRR